MELVNFLKKKVYELDQNINLPGLFVSRALWGGDQHALLLQCVFLYLCLSLTQYGQHAKNSTRIELEGPLHVGYIC